MINSLLRSIVSWYYRRQIKTDAGRMIFDSLLQVQNERDQALRTEPIIPLFITIPDNHIWADGVPFSKPNVVLPWDAPHEEVQASLLRGLPDYKADLSFLGFEIHYLTVNYQSKYLYPHPGSTISSIYLTGPFRSRDQIISEYTDCYESLRNIFGEPTHEEEVDFFLWPKHVKRAWINQAIRIDHSISDIKDSDPVNRILIRRRFTEAYYQRYPGAERI